MYKTQCIHEIGPEVQKMQATPEFDMRGKIGFLRSIAWLTPGDAAASRRLSRPAARRNLFSVSAVAVTIHRVITPSNGSPAAQLRQYKDALVTSPSGVFYKGQGAGK